MRPPQPSRKLLPFLPLFAPTSAQVGFSCNEVMDSGVHWNLKPLAGAHYATYQIADDPMMLNWTFGIDLCSELPLIENVAKDHQCPQGTRVCGIKREFNPSLPNPEADAMIRHWVALAGTFTMSSGRHLTVKPTRLKSSDSHADSVREGVKLELSGGTDPHDKTSGTPQKAIVDLICNKTMTGWEPAKDPKGQSERLEKRGDDDKEKKGDDELKALKVLSYKDEDVRGDIYGVLRMEWHSKYACEDAASMPAGDESQGWGFFTWFIIILFLAIAAYVIFGSWLNYNRYGARGFDLVPHADSIRDIPYVVKDFMRRMGSGGSRGGYAAV